jgi:hypothetical protein
MLAACPGSRSDAAETLEPVTNTAAGYTRPQDSCPNLKTHNRKQKTADVTQLAGEYGFRGAVTRGPTYCNPRS